MKAIRIFLILLSVSLAQFTFGQQVFPVQLNGVLVPPNSLLLSDYAVDRAQDLMFTATLNDPVEVSRDINFRLTVKNSGREILKTNPGFVSAPMQLLQFTPELLTGSELAPYLNVNSLISVSGNQASNALPEGYNQICLEVMDAQRGVPISRQVCVGGFFELMEPPLLDMPACGAQLDMPVTQNMMFRWLPRHVGLPNAPSLVEYEFTLVELLPGILNPNDGFEHAIQIYQTTVMNPTLLYMEGEPQLEPNKMYAWRVQARDPMGSKVFQNEGYSQVCTFSFGRQLVNNQPLSPNCEASLTDFGQVSNDGLSDGVLAVGDVVQLGFFQMEVTRIDGSGNGFTGKGKVHIPFLKAHVLVNFDQLKVNEEKRVYEVEKAIATFEAPFAFSETELTTAALPTTFSQSRLQQLETFLSDPAASNRRVSTRDENDETPIGLPLSLDKTDAQGNPASQVVLLDMQFTERQARLTAVSTLRNASNNELIPFASVGIGFTPFGIARNGALDMLIELELSLDNGDLVRYQKQDGTSGMNINCEGLESYALNGEYVFSRDNLLPGDGSGGNVIVGFEAETNDLFDFTATTTSMPLFTLPQEPGYVFQSANGRLDFSAFKNLENFSFPDSYQGNQSSLWKGFHFSQADVTLPETLKNLGVEELKKLNSSFMMIAQEGVFSSFSSKDILPLEKGRIRDWPYSIEEISLPVVESKVGPAILKGQIKVPTLDDPFSYEGNGDLASGKISEIRMNPGSGQVGMSLWNAHIELHSETVIEAVGRNINGNSELIPYANIHGDFSLEFKTSEFKKYLAGDKESRIERLKRALNLEQEPDLKLEKLLLKGYEIDPLTLLEERFRLLDYEKENPQITIGGKLFPISAANIIYVPKTENDKEELGLVLTVTEGTNQVGITIWAQKDNSENFILNRIDLDTKVIDCDCTFLEEERPFRWGSIERTGTSLASADLETNDSLYWRMRTLLEGTFPYSNSQITIPFLGKRDPNDASKFEAQLKLNVTSGGAGYIASTKVIGGSDVKNIGIAQNSSGTVKALDISNFEVSQAFVDGLAGQKVTDIPTELPIDLTENLKDFLGKYNPGQYPFPKDAKLLLVGFEAKSDLSSATAKIMMIAPYSTSTGSNTVTKWLAFGNSDVEIKPNAVGFKDLKLFLLKNHQNTDSRFPFEYFKKFNNEAETGSYAYLKCEGFQEYNVQARHNFAFEYETDGLGCKKVCGICTKETAKNGKTQLMEVNDVNTIATERKAWLNGSRKCKSELYKQLNLPFIIKGRDLKSFKAEINKTTLGALVLKDFETVLFHVEEAYVQYNFGKKPEWASAPPDSKFDQATFKGVHFKKLGLQPLGFHEGSSSAGNRKVLKIPVTDFVYKGGEGLYGNVDKSKIVEEGKGDIGGWKYALDKFKLNIKANKIVTPFNQNVINEENIRSGGGVILEGKILMPVVADSWEETDKDGKKTTKSGYMEFIGALGFDAGAQTPATFFRIEEAQQGQKFKVPFWNLFMQLGTNVETPTSTITLALNEDAGDYWGKSEFEPAAVLNGQFIIAYDPTKPEANGFYKEEGFMPAFSLPKLAFSNWKINDPNIVNSCKSEEASKSGIRNMHIDYFALGGGGSTGSVNQGAVQDLSNQLLSGLPVQIWDINFNCDKLKDGSWGYKMDFEVHVDVVGVKQAPGKIKKFFQKAPAKKPDSGTSTDSQSSQTKLGGSANASAGGAKKKESSQSELKVTGQLAIWSKFDNGSLKFSKVKPEAFLVDAQFSIFTLKGGFVLIGGDPVYGDGFKGYVDVGIDKWKGFRAKTVFQAGETDYDDSKGTNNPDNKFRYFFFDLEFLLEQGFGIPNPPLPDPVIYFHGAGGGFQYNMIVEDPAPEETFSKSKKSKGAKTVGAVSHDSGILSENADPYGYLKPGKSLTGYIFKPRPKTFGFGVKTIFSVKNSAQFAWFDAAINMSFNDKFVPLKINGLANLYMLTPGEDGKPASVGNPEGASGVGTVQVELNIEKKFLQAVATFDLNYPQSNDLGVGKMLKVKDMDKFEKASYSGDKQLFNAHAFGEASAVFLFSDVDEGIDLPLHKGGEWQVKIGTPKKGVGMEFQFLGITLGQMMMYMQAGYALDPMPHITELIPTWNSPKGTKPRTAANITKAYSGNGIIFGAHFKIPDNTYEFLIFRARLAAGAGFDISFLHYDDSFVQSLGCAGDNGKFGVNNWYARGQAYAYIMGSMDMHINLGFIDKWVNLITVNAAALVQAELPNPTWMRAAIKAQGSVLDGLIKVNIRFKVEVGKRCDVFAGNPIASIPVIESTAPANNAKEVPIYQNPVVSFNFPIEKLIVLNDYNEGIDPVQRSFRPHLKNMRLYKTDGGQRTLVKEGFLISADKYSATLPLDELLEPHTRYELEVEASWEEYVKGSWTTFIYNGKPYIESTNPSPIVFITGGRPHAINTDMLEYQAPGYKQRYWHKDYALPQLLFKQNGYDYMFPENTDKLKTELEKDKKSTEGLPSNIPLEYIIRLTEYNPANGSEKKKIELPIGQHPGKTGSVERPSIDYKTPSQYANLNYQLPFVKTTTVSGKSIEFRQLNDKDLQKGHLYQLEIVRRPVKAFSQEVQTEREESTALSESHTLATDAAVGQMDYADVGGTITRRVTKLKNTTPQPGLTEMNKVLYKYNFAVSQYDHLYQKLADMQVVQMPDLLAIPKEKYDHPKSRVQAFPTLPLGKTFKDRYFMFYDGKEGIDRFDRIKLLKNLVVKSPKIPIPMKEEPILVSGQNIGLTNLVPDVLTAGAHPWEKELYVNGSRKMDSFIYINKDEKENAAFDITDLDEKNILDDTRVEEINKKDDWRVIDPKGNHGGSGYTESTYGGKGITKTVVFNKFRTEIANHSWSCNKNYGESTWEAQNVLSEAGWKEFMQEILMPYYHVDDWAFHLRFSKDDYQLELSDGEMAAKATNHKMPNGTINGIIFKQRGHFAFEDARERILKTQFLLAKSVATNLIFISYLSKDDDKCKMGDMFYDVSYWFNRKSIGEGIAASEFNEKYLELAFPKLNKWQKFDEVVPENIRNSAGEDIWKLPLGSGNIETTEQQEGKREYVIKNYNKDRPDELYLFFPDFLGDELKKLAVYDDGTGKLLFFWDARLDEDHHYTHSSGNSIKMEVDYAPPIKKSGIRIAKGARRYHIIAKFSDERTDEIYSAKVDLSSAGTQSSANAFFASLSSGIQQQSSSKEPEFRPYELKKLSTNSGEGLQAKQRLKDYPWLRLEYDPGKGEIIVNRPIDLAPISGDNDYNFPSDLHIQRFTIYGAKPNDALRFSEYFNISPSSSSELKATSFDYLPTNVGGAQVLHQKTEKPSVSYPIRLHSSGLRPDKGDATVYVSKNPISQSQDLKGVTYDINRDFYIRGKGTILLTDFNTSAIDCQLKPLTQLNSTNHAINFGEDRFRIYPLSNVSFSNQKFTIDIVFKPKKLADRVQNSYSGMPLINTGSFRINTFKNWIELEQRTTNSFSVGGGATLSTGKWYRLTATYDGQVLSLLFNGQMVASKAVKPNDFHNFNLEPLTYGGAIDYIAIWNKPASVCGLWEASNSERKKWKTDKDLAVYYEFDSYYSYDGPSSNRITDLSTNGNDALITGIDFFCDASIWESVPKKLDIASEKDMVSVLGANGSGLDLRIIDCDLQELAAFNSSEQLLWYWEKNLGEVHTYQYISGKPTVTINKAPEGFKLGTVRFPASGVTKVFALSAVYTEDPKTGARTYSKYWIKHFNPNATQADQVFTTSIGTERPTTKFIDLPLLRINYHPEKGAYSIQALWELNSQLNSNYYSSTNAALNTTMRIEDIVIQDAQTNETIVYFDPFTHAFSGTIFRSDGSAPQSYKSADFGGAWGQGKLFRLPLDKSKTYKANVKISDNKGEKWMVPIDLNADFRKNNEVTVLLMDKQPFEACNFVPPVGSTNLVLKMDGTNDNYIESKLYPVPINIKQFMVSMQFKATELSSSIKLLDGPLNLNLSATGFQLMPGNLSVQHPIKKDQWYHFALSYDEKNIRMFVNGKEIFSKATSFDLDENKSLFIGKGFKGELDYINFWKKAFTSCSQILDSQSPAVSDEDLLFHYSFNNDNKALVNDLSNIKNNGTLHAKSFVCNRLAKNFTPLCAMDCGRSSVSDPLMVFYGSCSYNPLVLYFPDNIGTVNKMAIYDKSGRLQYFYDKNRSEEFPQVAGMSYNSNPPALTSGSSVPGGSYFYSDPYQIYTQIGNAFYNGRFTLQENAFQEFQFTKENDEPEQLTFPYPLIWVKNEYVKNYYEHKQSVSLRLRQPGKAFPKDAKLNLVRASDGKLLALLTDLNEQGFKLNKKEKGCELLSLVGTPVKWGEKFDLNGMLDNKEKEVYICANVNGNKHYYNTFLSDKYRDLMIGIGFPWDADEFTKQYITVPEFVRKSEMYELLKPTVSENLAFDLSATTAIQSKSVIAVSQKFSVSLRVKFDRFDAKNELINMTSSSGGLTMKLEEEGVRIYCNGQFLYAKQAFLANTWYLFTLTFDDTKNVKLYLDGKEIASSSPPNYKVVRGVIQLGGGTPTRVYSYAKGGYENTIRPIIDGKMDYFCIRNKALSAQEVLAEVTKAPVPGESDIYLLYHFNQIPSNTFIDNIINCNPGQLYKPGKSAPYSDAEVNQCWTQIFDTPVSSAPSKNLMLDFDGQDDMIELNAFEPTLTDFYEIQNRQFYEHLTIETWIRFNDFTGDGTIMNFADRTLKILPSGNLQYSDKKYSVKSTQVLKAEKWYHITVIKDGLKARLLIDGVQEAVAFPSTPQTSATGYFIGKINGQIDELMVWKEARADFQIQNDRAKGPGQQKDKLLLYYNFNRGGAGSRYLEDLSGAENNGRLLNMDANQDWIASTVPQISVPQPIAEANKPGNYTLEFDGSDDFIQLPGGNYTDKNMTLEAWVYPKSMTQGATIFNLNDKVRLYLNKNANGKPAIQTSENNSTAERSRILSSPYSIPTNQWTHIAVTLKYERADGTENAGYVWLYLNGELVAQQTQHYFIMPPSGNVTASYIGQKANARIDELRVWKEVRTNEQIRQNMNKSLKGDESGLALYYTFNHTTGSGTLKSALKNTSVNLDGTLKNMNNSSAWVPSGKGDGISLLVSSTDNALKMDGVDDYVEIPTETPLNFTKNFTIETWVKPTKDYGYLLQKGGNGFRLFFTPQIMFEFTGKDDNKNYYIGKGSATLNQWNHIAVTFDGKIGKVYLNGIKTEEKTLNMDVASFPSDNLLLGNNLNRNGAMKGELDELRIWNKVKTQAEIQTDMYKTAQGNEQNLLLYYNFNHPPGSEYVSNIKGVDLLGMLKNISANISWIPSTRPTSAPPSSAASNQSTASTSTSSSSTSSVNNVLDFDGQDDYVDCGTMEFSSKPITVEAWIKADNFGTINTVAGMEENGGIALLRILKLNDQLNWANGNGSPRVQFVVNLDNAEKSVAASDVLEAGKWYHLAGTYDGSKIRLYINGQERSVTSASGSLKAYGTFRISQSSGGRYFDGQIDNVMVWEVARSATQIQSDINAVPTSIPSELEVLYHFNQATGNSLINYANTNQVGSLKNMDAGSDWVTITDYQPLGTLSGSSSGGTSTASSSTSSSGTPITVQLKRMGSENPICYGSFTYLKVDISGGNAPYTIVYTDDRGNQKTVNNYKSGDPIKVTPSQPSEYRLLSMTDANNQQPNDLGSPVVVQVLTVDGPTAIDWQYNLLDNGPPKIYELGLNVSGGQMPCELTYTQNGQAQPPVIFPGQQIIKPIMDQTVFSVVKIVDSNGCILEPQGLNLTLPQ